MAGLFHGRRQLHATNPLPSQAGRIDRLALGNRSARAFYDGDCLVLPHFRFLDEGLLCRGATGPKHKAFRTGDRFSDVLDLRIWNVNTDVLLARVSASCNISSRSQPHFLQILLPTFLVSKYLLGFAIRAKAS